MQYGTPEYRENSGRASRWEIPSKVISVLMDKRPGFDENAARDLICAMMEMGYLVQELTVEEFLSKNVSELGFLLVLPHAESVPAVCAEPIETFWKQGGRLLVLGGRLFGHLVEAGESGFEYIPLKQEELPKDAVDAATSGRMYPIVMEGFTPSPKVFKVPSISTFLTETDQAIVSGTIQAKNEEVVCPQARHHGCGYRMGHVNRYIPMVSAVGEGGRADGRRGAAVFMMLQDTVGRPHYFVDDNRLGYVKGTSRGGCAAGIGFKRQDILNIDGMRELLEQLLTAMQRGVFLFEGGSNRYVAKPNEKLFLGTNVMNVTMDYLPITVELFVKKDGKEVFTSKHDELAMAADFTEIFVEYTPEEQGDYIVETVLSCDGRVIDRIEQEIAVAEAYVGKPEEFIKVEDGEFVLGGKQWRAYGFNYWPLYSTGFEWEDYWWGWLDRAYYDPIEIERDLKLMADMGINCLFTRLDGNPIGRSADTIRDFIRRCRRYDMHLVISFCNATAPLNFQPLAFKRFMEDTGLMNDPILFAHDIGWEVGAKFYINQRFVNQLDGPWQDWIVERYGSIENAEKDWGVPADRTDFGQVIVPPLEQFMKEGAWRVKVFAYRRFMSDFISRKWNDVLAELRQIDPNHLITCRTGPISGGLTAAINCGPKHLDFTTPEGWRMPNDDTGALHALAIPLAMKMYSGDKPTVWAEYGLSACEMGFRNFEWDFETLGPPEHGEKQQVEWCERFFGTHKAADINGTSPWWFPGGLRYSERSFCGFCGPEGMWRPCAEPYKELNSWFKKPREKKSVDYYVTMDEEQYVSSWYALLWGEDRPGDENIPVDFNNNRLTGEVRGESRIAVDEALRNGKTIKFRTPGMGTTSATMPMVAVGGTPLTGMNPPRYLDAEFNYLEIETANGERVKAKNGARIKADSIRLRACLGNIREATWLKPNGDEKGGVYLCVNGPCAARAAITADTAFLNDAQTEWVTLSGRGDYTLCMHATDVSSFGEIWHITIE